MDGADCEKGWRGRNETTDRYGCDGARYRVFGRCTNSALLGAMLGAGASCANLRRFRLAIDVSESKAACIVEILALGGFGGARAAGACIGLCSAQSMQQVQASSTKPCGGVAWVAGLRADWRASTPNPALAGGRLPTMSVQPGAGGRLAAGDVLRFVDSRSVLVVARSDMSVVGALPRGSDVGLVLEILTTPPPGVCRVVLIPGGYSTEPALCDSYDSALRSTSITFVPISVLSRLVPASNPR
ncbi:hypothetical protein EDC01DRAFT_631293 [Geopyxis carbonaria]|nr:hypothetical protein EDC01DRAFT_631293 [Geopyxis carbonaria]